jgi:hypothetical protein
MGDAAAQSCTVTTDQPTYMFSEGVNYSDVCVIRFVVTTQLSGATAADCVPDDPTAKVGQLRSGGKTPTSTILTIDPNLRNLTSISMYSPLNQSSKFFACLHLIPSPQIQLKKLLDSGNDFVLTYFGQYSDTSCNANTVGCRTRFRMKFDSLPNVTATATVNMTTGLVSAIRRDDGVKFCCSNCTASETTAVWQVTFNAFDSDFNDSVNYGTVTQLDAAITAQILDSNSSITSNSTAVQLAHELVQRAQIDKRNGTLGSKSLSVTITKDAVCEVAAKLNGPTASESHVAFCTRIALNVNATAISGSIYPLSNSETWSQTFEAGKLFPTTAAPASTSTVMKTAAVSSSYSWLHTYPISTVVSLQSSSTKTTNQSSSSSCEAIAVSTTDGDGVENAELNTIGIVVGCTVVGVVLIAVVVAVAIKKGKCAAKKHRPEESPRRNAPDEVPLQQPGPMSEMSCADSRCGRILIS